MQGDMDTTTQLSTGTRVHTCTVRTLRTGTVDYTRVHVYIHVHSTRVLENSGLISGLVWDDAVSWLVLARTHVWDTSVRRIELILFSDLETRDW